MSVQAKHSISKTASKISDVQRAPELHTAQVGQVVPCTPFVTTITDTVTTPIPAACLPVPAGATVACPTDISFFCTTGAPTPITPGEVSVPVTLSTSAFTLIIRNAAGQAICTIPSTSTPTTFSEIITCPVTAGVSCTCQFSNVTCQGCTFDATRTNIVCTYTLTLTVTCASVPAPTEIVCIDVDKVFDFCFEQDSGLTNCVRIPGDAGDAGDAAEAAVTPVTCGTPPAGSTVDCTVTDVRCTAGTPVPTAVPGFSTVAVVVTVRYNLTIFNPNGTIRCTITNNTFVFTKTVILCAPAGTVADCNAQVVCGPCMILPPSTGFPFGQVCCGFAICLLVESMARVKLLVPSNGFCTPAACQTGPFPPFTCPPSPLFPPQCF